MTDASILAVVGSFVAPAFAVVRLGLGQGRAAADRLCTVIEAALERQANALDRLATDLREQSAVLARIMERAGGAR